MQDVHAFTDEEIAALRKAMQKLETATGAVRQSPVRSRRLTLRDHFAQNFSRGTWRKPADLKKSKH